MVDGQIAEEVHRADHVVEVARLEQARDAVLAAGDEIGLDAAAQSLLTEELDVRVEVVDRGALPQVVLPHVERGGEAIDVLADAQLADAAFFGDEFEPVGVRGREVLLGGRARLVGAQVDVVVGQHSQGFNQRTRSRRAAGRRRPPGDTARSHVSGPANTKTCTRLSRPDDAPHVPGPVNTKTCTRLSRPDDAPHVPGPVNTKTCTRLARPDDAPHVSGPANTKTCTGPARPDDAPHVSGPVNTKTCTSTMARAAIVGRNRNRTHPHGD
ncbi:MAG: hypothetical protein PGN13_12245 [Patulibacter minatonensis]